MNNTKIRKILPRLALLLALVTVFMLVMASCSSNTVIQTKNFEEWAKTDVNLAFSTSFLDKALLWIGRLLGGITQAMPGNNYILTLCVFGLVLEILMLPFGIKQQKNSIKQARLKPKEQAIRKKYAGRNDQATQQKVTQEIQELYQQENFNPMGGCLPMLLQLPALLLLYWIVVDPIQYVWGGSREFISVLHGYITAAVENGGLGMSLTSSNGSIEILSLIKSMSQKEFYAAFDGLKDFCANGSAVFAELEELYFGFSANFNIGPINFGMTPHIDLKNFAACFQTVQAWLLLIPILTFVVYFFSMKINRKLQFQPTQSVNDKQQACSNNMMDFTMPLMSVWMTFMVPAAVGIYWMFKSVLGVLKQFILSKAMPLPTFTEEDYKAAEKELLGKQPKKITKSENAGKVRSLHHIDDEDYDEKGNYAPKAPEKSETPEEHEAKLQNNSMTEGASLKDESDKLKNFFSRFGKKDKKD